MKKVLSLILAFLVCLSLSACGEDTPTVPNDTEPSTTVHTHSWKDATCDVPKTCETCGETEGEKLEHQWGRESCADPYTCGMCSAMNGEGDKHYVSDSVCSSCGKTLEELEKEPGYQYQLALELLSSRNSKNEEFAKAYQLLSGLGDYKDAKEYLSCFTILSDMRLCWTCEETNTFGEVVDTYVLSYDYDQNGNLIKAPCVDYYSADILSYVHLLAPNCHYEYRYDDSGRIVEREHGTVEYYEVEYYEYNEKGQLAKIVSRDSDNSTKAITDFTYNEDGLCIRDDTLYDDGDSYFTEYTYDNEGRVLQKKTYDKAYPDILQITGYTLSSYEYYEYDNEGKCIKLRKGVDGERHTCEFIYENNRVIAVNCHNQNKDTMYVTNYTYGDYYCYTPAE